MTLHDCNCMYFPWLHFKRYIHTKNYMKLFNFVSVKKGKGPKMNLSVVVPKINNFFVPGKAKSAKQTSLHGL